jgi:hypothetical protein
MQRWLSGQPVKIKPDNQHAPVAFIGHVGLAILPLHQTRIFYPNSQLATRNSQLATIFYFYSKNTTKTFTYWTDICAPSFGDVLWTLECIPTRAPMRASRARHSRGSPSISDAKCSAKVAK